jgi:hypothetical protein
MNTRPHVSFRVALALGVVISASVTLLSCADLDLTGRTRARQAEARAREPYYGKGTVARVIGPGLVELTFASSALPATMAKLIIVRDNVVVAKVKFNGGAMDDRYLCEVLEGTPQEGDLALGWQREAEFTPPSSPPPPSPWRKLP